MLSKLKEYDFYRRIPRDLTETTAHGSCLSVCASLFMLILFIAELWSFLTLQTMTHVIIEPNTDSLLRINFNITVLDIACEYAVIDVVDILGTRKDNITKNINKWQVDKNGVRKNYEGRNMEQKDLLHDVHHDIDALVLNGTHYSCIFEFMKSGARVSIFVRVRLFFHCSSPFLAIFLSACVSACLSSSCFTI